MEVALNAKLMDLKATYTYITLVSVGTKISLNFEWNGPIHIDAGIFVHVLNIALDWCCLDYAFVVNRGWYIYGMNTAAGDEMIL